MLFNRYSLISTVLLQYVRVSKITEGNVCVASLMVNLRQFPSIKNPSIVR